MTPLVDDGDLRIYCGDALDVLSGLPSESVDCVATSPPFYALRDYGTGTWQGGDEACDHKKVSDPVAAVASSTLGGGKKSTGHLQEGYGAKCGRCGATRVDRQIGLEATPEEWAAALVAVFAECRRVLKPAGSMFVECGDSYNAQQGNGWRPDASSGRERPASVVGGEVRDLRASGLKPKDLLGQPFLLAFALRSDGWYWRGCYPWAKPNAMPESAQDRCTTAHSYVLHFAKNARYFFDGDAIAEPAAWERWGDQTVPKYEGTDTASGWMQPKTKAELRALSNAGVSGIGSQHKQAAMGRSTAASTLGANYGPETKHPRSVWTIPTRGYPGAHFATWPEALAERIILAGCPPGGTVLDPFAGSGTTGLVARKHGRRSILIELSPAYAKLASERCQQLSLLAEPA